MPAGHSISDLWDQVTPGSVFFIYLLIIICIYVTRLIIGYCSIKCCFSHVQEANDIQVTQELTGFYSSLSTKTRESLIREEVQHALRLGI